MISLRSSIGLIVGLILISLILVTASQAIDFKGYGIYFPIPENWTIKENCSNTNDTMIVLTDGVSNIRIDVVKLSQLLWLRNISKDEFSIGSIVTDFYQNKILNDSTIEINSRSASDKLHPDGIRSLTFSTGRDGGEWIAVWSKSEYGDKFIGVHAVFSGEQQIIDLSEGKGDYRYNIPISLYNLLNSFETKNPTGLPNAKIQKKNFGTKDGAVNSQGKIVAGSEGIKRIYHQGARELGEKENSFHFIIDTSICPSRLSQNREEGITNDGIIFVKYYETDTPIPDDGRFSTIWLTVYDKPIRSKDDETIKSIKTLLGNDEATTISNRTIDGHEAIVGVAINRSTSANRKLFATFWLDESNGYGRIRCNILSNPDDAINLDTLHIMKLGLPSAPPRSGEL